MHSLLDEYAHRNALREVDIRVKLLLGLGGIIISVFSTSPAGPLFVAATISLAALLLARIPPRLYFTLLLIPLSFSLLSASVVALIHGRGDLLLSAYPLGYPLEIRADGANMGVLLVSRTLGSMCSLFFISLTTPMIEIFAGLRALAVPQFLIELSMMIYRYIFVFLDQATMIHNAQKMRLGDSDFKISLKSFAMLSSVLFLRSWEQGERIILAMDARCYDGRLDLLDQRRRADPTMILGVIAYLVAAFAVAFLTRGAKPF